MVYVDDGIFLGSNDLQLCVCVFLVSGYEWGTL